MTFHTFSSEVIVTSSLGLFSLLFSTGKFAGDFTCEIRDIQYFGRLTKWSAGSGYELLVDDIEVFKHLFLQRDENSCFHRIKPR